MLWVITGRATLMCWHEKLLQLLATCCKRSAWKILSVTLAAILLMLWGMLCSSCWLFLYSGIYIWHPLHSGDIHKALNIIYIGTYGMPYTNFLAGLMSLTERREQLARKFFDSLEERRSCLHHLFPPVRDSILLSRWRAPSKFPHIPNRTKKY